MLAPSRVIPALLVLGPPLLAACAGPEIDPPPTFNAREARLRLEDAAAEGPVLLEVRGADSAAWADRLAADLERGIRFTTVRFTADPAEAGDPGFRVVALTPPGPGLRAAEACAGGGDGAGAARPAGGGAFMLVACDEAGPLAEGRGTIEAGGDYARLVQETAGATFPDDYEGGYAGGSWPFGLNLGLGIGSGGGVGGGVGVGVGF